MIGAALAGKAVGQGFRTLAAGLGRPADTVRGWLRAFGAVADRVREYFTVLAARLDTDPALPDPAPSGFADAVAAVLAAGSAAAGRWPELAAVSPWRLATAATNGQLIFPAWRRSSINTGRLWAALM